MTQERKDSLKVALEAAKTVVLPILLGIAGWAFMVLSDHEKRLTVIESSNPTRLEMSAEVRNLSDMLSSIRVELGRTASFDVATTQQMARLEARLDQIIDALQKQKEK